MGYHSQTVIQERYALYWDLVEAKCGHTSPALSVYQEDLNWQSFSYDSIHLRVNQLAIRWADAGVGQGSTVTLLVPMGYQFLLGLLTGLKLGATVGWVSPDGPTYIDHRLKRLGSEFIAANHRHYPDLEGTPSTSTASVPNKSNPYRQRFNTKPRLLHCVYSHLFRKNGIPSSS